MEVEADSSASTSASLPQKLKETKKRSWPCTSIYVTGLAADITAEELRSVFSKCGVIIEHPETGEIPICNVLMTHAYFFEGDPLIKLYRDDRGKLKGDAAITFLKSPSVELACKLYDGLEMSSGAPITVREVCLVCMIYHGVSLLQIFSQAPHYNPMKGLPKGSWNENFLKVKEKLERLVPFPSDC